jgi:hypothetical protein
MKTNQPHRQSLHRAMARPMARSHRGFPEPLGNQLGVPGAGLILIGLGVLLGLLLFA